MMAETNEMERCIDSCLTCYRTCVKTAMTHCLEVGGEHVEMASSAIGKTGTQ
ncbi:hypothetical protein LMG26691_02235 [Achromobacter animicus]|nr:hypothetical protein LMG26691_02235 [Achromobacter animicus]